MLAVSVSVASGDVLKPKHTISNNIVSVQYF